VVRGRSASVERSTLDRLSKTGVVIHVTQVEDWMRTLLALLVAIALIVLGVAAGYWLAIEMGVIPGVILV